MVQGISNQVITLSADPKDCYHVIKLGSCLVAANNVMESE